MSEPTGPKRTTTASLSKEIAATTKTALRLAVAEAREVLKDTRVEFRVERLSREESRLRTRGRLLDAAAEVFNRVGYHGASLEAVAEAAGYTKGAVYSNFATKGELFVALLERYTKERIALQDSILKSVTLEQLADGAAAAMRQQASEQSSWDLLQIEFWLAAMRDPELRARLVEGSDELYREVGGRLDAKAAGQGVETPFHGTELARLLNALGSGLLLQMYLEPDAIDPTLYGRAIRLLLGLPVEAALTDDPEASEA
jgi:AcrR family transcriptional regulator